MTVSLSVDGLVEAVDAGFLLASFEDRRGISVPVDVVIVGAAGGVNIVRWRRTEGSVIRIQESRRVSHQRILDSTFIHPGTYLPRTV